MDPTDPRITGMIKRHINGEYQLLMSMYAAASPSEHTPEHFREAEAILLSTGIPGAAVELLISSLSKMTVDKQLAFVVSVASALSAQERGGLE